MAIKRNLQPALDAAQNQLGLTFSASDALDGKALGILAFNAALLIFTLQSEMQNQWWLLAPLFVILVISSLYTIRTIWPDRYIGAIVDLRDHPQYLQLSEDALVLQLLADTQEAIRINTSKNEQKSRCCTLSIILSLLGVGLLVWCIL